MLRDGFTYLTPYKHCAKHDLQAIEEVVADDDDSRTPCRPAFAGAYGFDCGRGSTQKTYIKTKHIKFNKIK